MLGKSWSHPLSVALLAVAAWTVPSGPATAAPLPDPCAGARPDTVLVHDLASTAETWTAFTADLAAAGRCATTVSWGEPAAGDLPLPLAGLRGTDAGARDLAEALDALCGDDPTCTVDVVAHGAGSLVVQRYLQEHGPGPVRSLTTLGAMWHGTEIGGLAAAEQISRDVGTYDLVLGLEKPIVDPVCAGCREIVAGSDLLRDLHARGVPTPGVRYTDIVSTCDLLVVPPERGALPGSTVVTLAGVPTGSDSTGCVDHWRLPHDPAARAAVVAALPAGDL